jgi:hypothetical protein
MKTFVAALLAGAVLFSSGAEILAVNADQQIIISEGGDKTVQPAVEVLKAQRYVCPSTRYIDCMPPLKESNRRWCDPEYLRWARNNCPGLKIVY